MNKTILLRTRSHILTAVCWLLPLIWLPQMQAQALHFANLDDLFAYADAHSAITRSADAQTELAKLQSIAAIANTVNVRGTASFTSTDNFKLPVNFLPAEIFGGPAGTFRQVSFGQQFVSVANIAPQLDLVNPSTWARISSARTSAELTDVSNNLNRRNLHESIATAFYNYRSAEAQLKIAEQNLTNADTITAIVGQRYNAGIIRKQDYNNALANRMNLADFVQQLGNKKLQQILVIRALLGLKGSEIIRFADNESNRNIAFAQGKATSQLLGRQATLQANLQRSELLATRLNFAPTISLVAGFNWQQNSNDGFFNQAAWIRSRFVGLKLSIPLPTETKLWSQTEEFRINLHLKEIAAEQSSIQETIQNQQLELDITRGTQAVMTAETIGKLKNENYQSAILNYREGILSEDQLLTAFTELLNAELASENAHWSLEFLLTKLALNQLDN